MSIHLLNVRSDYDLVSSFPFLLQHSHLKKNWIEKSHHKHFLRLKFNYNVSLSFPPPSLADPHPHSSSNHVLFPHQLLLHPHTHAHTCALAYILKCDLLSTFNTTCV